MKFFFLLLTTLSCMIPKSDIYEIVISDFNRYSYFIALEITSSEYTGPAIIENDDLYYFFNQTKGIGKDEYLAKMKAWVENRAFFEIGEENLMRWNFIRVHDQNEVNTIAERGVESFINRYFEGRVLKDEITEEEQAAIIYNLFNWGVYAKIDGESGYLIIRK